jgi:predicted nucleic acid-binding protein
MVGYLLDTNHLSRLVNTQRHPLHTDLQAAIKAGDVFFIILPIITETVAGFSILPRATQNWAEWQVLRPNLILLPLDEADAVGAARLQVALRRTGRQLMTVDALIATIALRYDLTLLTTDRDFTSVPLLRQENWLAG